MKSDAAIKTFSSQVSSTVDCTGDDVTFVELTMRMLDVSSVVVDAEETAEKKLSFTVLVVWPTDDSCPVWLEDQFKKFWIVVCLNFDVGSKLREVLKNVDSEEDGKEAGLKMVDESKGPLLLEPLLWVPLLVLMILLVCSRFITGLVSEDIPNMLEALEIAETIFKRSSVLTFIYVRFHFPISLIIL